jgi:HK97 family phage major capsid protein
MERADKKADETLKREIDNLMTKFNDRMDAMEVANKKNQESIESKQGFKAALTKSLNEGALDVFTKGNSNAHTIQLKADMTIGADFTGDVIPPERVAGYKYDPSRQFHMRQILPVGNTSSDVVRYVKESGYSDGSAMKNEGSTLGQSDFDMQAVSTPVEKLGAYFRISEEMMDSTPQLTSYLSARAPEKLLAVEDSQILDGNGSAPNLTGIYTNATSFSAGAFANAVESANEFDCITVALNQLSLANYVADYILMNPSDFHKILLLKSSQNEYLVKNSCICGR